MFSTLKTTAAVSHSVVWTLTTASGRPTVARRSRSSGSRPSPSQTSRRRARPTPARILSGMAIPTYTAVVTMLRRIAPSVPSGWGRPNSSRQTTTAIAMTFEATVTSAPRVMTRRDSRAPLGVRLTG
ncbi:hypothetical protein BH23ACT9_BH23ACT9_06090 [soil metagenome]